MHDKGNDIENSVSVPKLLESLRSSKLKDHEDLMNLIFEVSGVSEHLKKAKVLFLIPYKLINDKIFR